MKFKMSSNQYEYRIFARMSFQNYCILEYALFYKLVTYLLMPSLSQNDQKYFDCCLELCHKKHNSRYT